MSYVTTADHRLTTAKFNIKEAIKQLSDICIGECAGSDDFSDESKKTQMEILFELIKIRAKL